jgi:hypothetical protein
MKKCTAVVEIIPEERRLMMSMKKSREIIKKRKKESTHMKYPAADAMKDIEFI